MRLQALDGWRFIAAMMVAMFHLMAAHSLFYTAWLRQMAPLLELFFILSGFVMALIYAQRVTSEATFASFIMARVRRLWPPHAVALLILVVLELGYLVAAQTGVMRTGVAPFTDGRSIDWLFQNLALVQSWGLVKAFNWNFPSWTVSTEFAAYILMGLLSLLVAGRRLRVLIASIIIVGALAMFYRQTEGFTLHDTISVSRCVAGFFIGYLLCMVWKKLPLKGFVIGTICEAACVAGMFLCFQLHFEGFAYLLNYVLFAALVYVFASGQGALSRLIGAEPIARLGERSYSIYLVHAVVLAYLDFGLRAIGKVFGVYLFSYSEPLFNGRRYEIIDLGSAFANDLLMLAYLVAVVIAGSILFRYVEAPSRVSAAKTARDAQPAAGPAAAPAATIAAASD